MRQADGTCPASAIVILALGLATFTVPTLAQGVLFDIPLKQKVLDLGLSPYVGNFHSKLSCFYFPDFMIKQFDVGQKGAESLSIIPIAKGKIVACSPAQSPGEMPIEVFGYFKGARGNLVFVDAPDGIDGGIPLLRY